MKIKTEVMIILFVLECLILESPPATRREIAGIYGIEYLPIDLKAKEKRTKGTSHQKSNIIERRFLCRNKTKARIKGKTYIS